MTTPIAAADETFENLRKLAAAHFKVDPSTLDRGTRLREDLRADSLDLILLVHDLEDHFGINIAQESLESVKTLGDAAVLVASAPRR